MLYKYGFYIDWRKYANFMCMLISYETHMLNQKEY